MTVDNQISQVERALAAGRYDEIVANYDFPLPIYVNGVATVIATRPAAESFYQALHALIEAQGYGQISGRAVSVELPKRGRFRVWTEWSGVALDGARDAALGQAQVLYQSLCYNVLTEGGHRTEMVTLESRALREIERLLIAA